MRIAITGAAGFLGLNLVRTLAARGHEVFAIDRRFSARAERALADVTGVERHEADILDGGRLQSLLGGIGPDRVFVGAALTADINRERTDFADVLDVNVVGTARTLEACRKAGVDRIVVASSSAVYGDAVFRASPAEIPSPEPVTLYGISKLAAERAAMRFASINELDLVAVRIAAVFGAWEYRSGARDVMSPLCQLAERAASGQPARLAAGGERDWIDAGRAAEAVAGLMERPRLDHRLYNIGASRVWSPSIFAAALAARFPGFTFEETGGDPDIDYRDDLTRRRHPLDTTRIRDELGSEILGDPTADTEAFARWCAANRDWFSNSPM